MMLRHESVSLVGKRILVAEDRATLALELCDLLEDEGCVVVGPAAKVARAAELVDEPMDAALVDIDLKGEPSFPVARQLRARDIPVLLLTGFDDASLPEDLKDLQVLEKPVATETLFAALQQLFDAE